MGIGKQRGSHIIRLIGKGIQPIKPGSQRLKSCDRPGFDAGRAMGWAQHQVLGPGPFQNGTKGRGDGNSPLAVQFADMSTQKLGHRPPRACLAPTTTTGLFSGRRGPPTPPARPTIPREPRSPPRAHWGFSWDEAG